MILRFVLPLGILALAASAAHADVLEIGGGGEASWVAGPHRNPAPATQRVIAPEVIPAGVPAAYGPKVAELAARYDLSPSLIEALVWQESRWNAAAVSPVGAQGLAQLMPGTARDLGVDSRDPFANLEGGARYLRAQIDRFGGDIEKALAAYNAGPGRVQTAGGIPAIRETRNYVASVMGRLSDRVRRPQ